MTIESMTAVWLMTEVYSPLMHDRGFEVVLYGVTTFPTIECFHVEVIEKSCVYRLTLQPIVIDD
jgi:hypothetical protein